MKVGILEGDFVIAVWSLEAKHPDGAITGRTLILGRRPTRAGGREFFLVDCSSDHADCYGFVDVPASDDQAFVAAEVVADHALALEGSERTKKTVQRIDSDNLDEVARRLKGFMGLTVQQAVLRVPRSAPR